ncbi:helix-turn-helix domain-containing protein [Streptomyces sp. NPDC091281]|uniref:helix-turn-helix domain-containing protein n=1 Tax=Streptomyces sp. NPDC091281 TaxID=3365985 RepID=UPI00382F7A73
MQRELEDDDWLRSERQRIGRSIKAAREYAGKTQEQVFLAVPLNRSHYQEVEAGRANPSLNTLLAIARAIGVSVADLLRQR